MKAEVTLHLEPGVTLETIVSDEEFPEADTEAALVEDLTDYIQDHETGVWKTIGSVTFIWKRLIAFDITNIY
jgi:hypothetical protein